MLNEFDRTPAAPLPKEHVADIDASHDNSTVNDIARLGLVKEMMQVILGLTPETMDRVMRTIRGSTNAADIKTVNMRQRIGNRAMRYLRNAIDQARTEGNEQHTDDPDLDDTKIPDLEPGHMNSRRHPKMQQSTPRHGPEMDESTTTSFKNFLIELNIDVDLEDPGAATAEIKRAARMGADRAATQNVQNAKNDMDIAKNADPTDPTRQIDIKIAALNSQLAMLQKRKAQMTQQQGNM